jgi:hypothetical protein
MMDAVVVETCRNCGAPLTEPRKLKDFCNYSCRGQHSVNALDGEKYRVAYLGSKNTKRTKALRSLKRQSVGHFTFCKINPVTCRIDRQGKNGVGWLTEVAWPGETKKQRWIACVGNHRSEPLRLGEVKESARALLTTKNKAEPRDFIKELNQLAANEVDQAYWTQEKRTWPLELMGGQRHRKPLREVERNLRQAILDTEQVLKDDKPATGSVQGEDCQLEYYEDGYPKPPTCLDRREAAA